MYIECYNHHENNTDISKNENSISVNKAKIEEDKTINSTDLINGKHILLQRGKKNYFLVKAV